MPVVLRRRNCVLFAQCDEDFAVRSVPRRNLMAPPELARDAPGLDVFHPVEIGRFPILRDELGLAVAHGGNRRLRQFLRVDVPLVGEKRLDDDIRAVAVRHDVRVRLDFLDQALFLQPRDDLSCARRSGRCRACASVASRSADFGTPVEKRFVILQRELGLDSEDIDLRQIVPLADFEIVEVVRRRDLHRARALLRIGVFVGDDRNLAGRPAAG